MSQYMPGGMPVYMPDRMPGGMSEYMRDKTQCPNEC